MTTKSLAKWRWKIYTERISVIFFYADVTATMIFFILQMNDITFIRFNYENIRGKNKTKQKPTQNETQKKPNFLENKQVQSFLMSLNY